MAAMAAICVLEAKRAGTQNPAMISPRSSKISLQIRHDRVCEPYAIIDCCTREIVAWQLELRCRADEAIAVVERAAASYGIEPGELTLGSDNGSAFTARRLRTRLGELGIRHRRGGYRDPESRPSSKAGSGNSKNGRCG
jgi:transposase InsO family protein